ncbi:MAG TPA: ABC transporter permease [Lachnospiraceae bacterium]|nr:ABC transporter permease [Lachnospiraceae bacterium]
MKLFRVYRKVLKKNLPVIFAYMVILYAIILVMIFQVRSNANSYEEDRITVVLINEDVTNEFTRGLKQYLGERVNLIDNSLYSGNIQSALFYQTADYIIKLPKGFYEELYNYENDKGPVIYKYTAASTYAGKVMDKILKEYCDWWLAYREMYPDMSEQEILEKVTETMNMQSSLLYSNRLQISASQKNMYYFFNYASYSIMGIIGMGVVSALLLLGKSKVYERTAVSPVAKSQIELELLLYNTGFAVLIWAAHVLGAMALFHESFFTWTGFFMCMNTFALSMVSVGISYLMLCFVNSRGGIGIFVNLIVFAMCFISGTFIPQYLLDTNVRSAAVFIPVFWYIRANDLINETGALSLLTLTDTLTDLIRLIGTQYLFAVMFFCAAMFITKQRGETVIGG